MDVGGKLLGDSRVKQVASVPFEDRHGRLYFSCHFFARIYNILLLPSTKIYKAFSLPFLVDHMKLRI